MDDDGSGVSPHAHIVVHCRNHMALQKNGRKRMNGIWAVGLMLWTGIVIVWGMHEMDKE
jgi:hypothetical protein